MKKYTHQGKVDTRSGFGAGLLVFSMLFVLTSCSANIEGKVEPNQNPHRIELKEALTHLDAFLLEYAVQTKSENCPERHYSMDGVSEVKSSKIFPSDTKSDESALIIPEDLLYLVNFNDSLGFAVLAADDRLCNNIMCVTESGSLSTSDFIEAGTLLFASTKVAPADSVDMDSFIDLGKVTVPSLLLSSAIGSIVNYSEGPNNVLQTKASPPTSTKYGPFVHTKWDQETAGNHNVFNVYTPNNAPAGCVVIAVAQILLSTKGFVFNTSDNYVCSSSDMLTVAPYSSPGSTGINDAAVQAGKFVYELGSSRLLVNVSYPNVFHNGTSATADDAKRALEAFMYSNVVKRLGFGESNQDIATAQIRAGRPVYLGGLKDFPQLVGHAWLLDGEWDPYYHINWGWNGYGDGYYTKGVFDTSERQLYDSQIDNLTYSLPINPPRAYTWSYRMVTYSL